MKKILFPIAVIVAIISVFGNVMLFLRYSSTRPLISVNGVAITRKQFQDRVDFLYARPLLSQMIWQQIVMQAATKSNCVPTNLDVDQAMAELERTTPNVIENARKQDPSLGLFKEDLKSNLALRNLRMSGISVSPDEVQAFYNLHKSLFKLPEQTQTTLVIASNQVDAETAQRLLQDGVAPGIIAQQQGLGVVGLNVRLNQQLPEYVGQEVLAMKNGDVKVIPIGSSFAIVKAKSVAGSGIPPLSQIADQVRIAATLSKAPSEAAMLKTLRSAAQITAEVGKYEDAIPELPSDDSASPTTP
jgi:hypothetical protein